MNEANGRVSMLVLGMEASGKSAYIGQLLGRVQRVAESSLTLRATPDSIKPYLAVLNRLEQGLPPEHTEANAYSETPLLLEHASLGAVEVVWPEYAGEQVKDLLNSRSVTPAWRSRVVSSDVWMLFVRPSLISVPEDLISRRILPAPPVVRKGPKKPTDNQSQLDSNTEISAQTGLIELLQLLLFVKGIGVAQRVQLPILGIMLSCLDEVSSRDSGRRPNEILMERVPLLAAFLSSVWSPRASPILGVAALGQPLNPNKPNEDFALNGPENEGYLVLPDGSPHSDLTLGVSLLLEKLRET